jgi:hypothetical protein
VQLWRKDLNRISFKEIETICKAHREPKRSSSIGQRRRLSSHGIRNRKRRDTPVDQGARIHGCKTAWAGLSEGRRAIHWWSLGNFPSSATRLSPLPLSGRWNYWPDDIYRWGVLHRQRQFVVAQWSAPSLTTYFLPQPQAIRTRLDVYGENARKIVPIDSPQFGRVIAVCVGAMMVGSIKTTVQEGEVVKRGQEFGFFAFGAPDVSFAFLSFS